MYTQQQKKQFKGIGHQLDPVVTIAAKGLSESVLAELERALDDHELIKVRFIHDRQNRAILLDELVKLTRCEVIQTIGGIALILRKSEKPNAALSTDCAISSKSCRETCLGFQRAFFSLLPNEEGLRFSPHRLQMLD